MHFGLIHSSGAVLPGPGLANVAIRLRRSHVEHRSTLEPFTHAPIRIGVMGAAGGELPAHLAELARDLGAAIASQGCCLLTGACPGLPHEAVRRAKTAGGHVVGISPAVSLREHVEVFGSPYREYDVMIYTFHRPVQPRAKRLRLTDASDALIRLEQRLLHHILGILGMSADGQPKAIRRWCR